MCLGIPMQIVEIDGYNARCTARGVTREVSLLLLQDEALAAGDYVVVNVGHAIHKTTEQEARLTWELLDQILAPQAGTLPSGTPDALLRHCREQPRHTFRAACMPHQSRGAGCADIPAPGRHSRYCRGNWF